MSDENQVSLRKSMKLLGYGALGVSLLGTGTLASAQPASIAAGQVALQAKLSDPAAVRSLTLTKRLPSTTPIVKMLSPAGAKALTPAAQTLTKADLVALSDGRVTPNAAKLSVQDVNSIKAAFARPGNLAASVDVSCCCCTPCCCAAAVESELALAA